MNLEHSEKTKLGMAKAKELGIHVGRPRKYRNTKREIIMGSEINKLKTEIKTLKQMLDDYTLPGNGKRSIRNKERIMTRDKNRCRICGSTELLEFHHVMPHSLGGDNSNFNIMVLCSSCHLFMHCNPRFIAIQKKNHKTATQMGMEKARDNGVHIGRPKRI